MKSEWLSDRIGRFECEAVSEGFIRKADPMIAFQHRTVRDTDRFVLLTNRIDARILQRFEQPHPGPIQQHTDQMRNAVQAG